MIWKEFLHPVLGRFRKLVFGALIALLLATVVSAFVTASSGSIDLFGMVMVTSVVTMVALGILFTLIIPATVITSEKEAGSWQMLLTTCYGDWQILGGKIVGIIRRIVLAWLPFSVIFLMASVFFDNPLSLLSKLMFAAFMGVGFVISTGLYFSSRFRHTTTAVICNLSLAAILWIGLPWLAIAYREISHSYAWLTNRYYSWSDMFEFTPPGMIMRIMDQGSGISVSVWVLYAALHLAAMGLFLWRAKVNLRKRIC